MLATEVDNAEVVEGMRWSSGNRCFLLKTGCGLGHFCPFQHCNGSVCLTGTFATELSLQSQIAAHWLRGRAEGPLLLKLVLRVHDQQPIALAFARCLVGIPY